MAQCREIGKAKMKDLNANDLEQAATMIKGTARSMGIRWWSKTHAKTRPSAWRNRTPISTPRKLHTLDEAVKLIRERVAAGKGGRSSTKPSKSR